MDGNPINIDGQVMSLEDAFAYLFSELTRRLVRNSMKGMGQVLGNAFDRQTPEPSPFTTAKVEEIPDRTPKPGFSPTGKRLGRPPGAKTKKVKARPAPAPRPPRAKPSYKERLKAPLTDRERTIADLFQQGKNPGEIADMLGIQRHSVTWYKSMIQRKTGSPVPNT